MKKTRNIAFYILVAVVCSGLSVANVYGQDQVSNDQSALFEDASVLKDDVSDLTPGQMLELAQGSIHEMKSVLDETNDLLERVRSEERDILKINCLTEKIAPLKGFLRVSEQSYVDLRESVGRNDREASAHHYTLIAIAKQRVDDLREETRICAGEVVRYAEGTEVEVSVEPEVASEGRDIVRDDPSSILALDADFGTSSTEAHQVSGDSDGNMTDLQFDSPNVGLPLLSPFR